MNIEAKVLNLHINCIKCFGFDPFELIGFLHHLGLFRFELKYFDPFLVLDEFSGEKLCFFALFCMFKMRVMIIFFSRKLES